MNSGGPGGYLASALAVAVGGVVAAAVDRIAELPHVVVARVGFPHGNAMGARAERVGADISRDRGLIHFATLDIATKG